MPNSPQTQPWHGFWEGWGGFWCFLDFRWRPAFFARWVSNYLEFHCWSVLHPPLPSRIKRLRTRNVLHHLCTKHCLPRPVWTVNISKEGVHLKLTEAQVTSEQNLCTKIIYIVLQTSVQLFEISSKKIISSNIKIWSSYDTLESYW